MKNFRGEILKILDGHIDENYIENLCIEKGVFYLSETIFLYTRNTCEEVADILNISTRTVNRRIKKFIDVIKLSWKRHCLKKDYIL